MCYSDCPDYTEPANEDQSKCVPSETCASAVSNLWVSGFIPLINDAIFSMVCNKVSFTKPSGGCPTGYTEWRDEQCYVNCPPGMIENGLTCLRKPISRQSTMPICSNIFLWYSGNECSINIYSGMGIFFILLIFLIYLMKPYFPDPKPYPDPFFYKKNRT